jgi:ferritin
MKKTPTTPKRPARRTPTPPATDGSTQSQTAGKPRPGKKANATAHPDKNGESEAQSESLVKPININVSVLRRSKQHAKELGVKTLKEYAESALLYFVKNGLDPTEQLHSGQVSVEVVKLRNQIFSFLQKQEQSYILPIFREVTGQGEGVEKSLSTMISQLEKVYELLYRINQMVQVSTSTTLFVSGLASEQIEDVKEKNKAFVENQVSEFRQKRQG